MTRCVWRPALNSPNPLHFTGRPVSIGSPISHRLRTIRLPFVLKNESESRENSSTQVLKYGHPRFTEGRVAQGCAPAINVRRSAEGGRPCDGRVALLRDRRCTFIEREQAK